MFKKEIAIMVLLFSTFLIFTVSDIYSTGSTSLAEVDKVCSADATSALCSDLSNALTVENFKSGVIYIILVLSNLVYALFLSTKIGVYHNSIQKQSIFSSIAELLFEIDDKVEEYILPTNKPYAPAFIEFEDAVKYGLVPIGSDVRVSTKKFLYELQNINGQQTFVRVKSI